MDPSPDPGPLIFIGPTLTDTVPAVILDALNRMDEEEYDAPFSLLYRTCRQRAEEAAAAGGASFYLSARDMAGARAALLAARETADLPVVTIFACQDGEKLSSGTEIAALFVVMQAMGADLFCLCPGDTGCADELVEEMAPYARIPVVVVMPNGMLRYIRTPDLKSHKDPDIIPCATGRRVQYIDRTIDVGEEIACSSLMAEDIIDAEGDPAGAMKILIESEEDLSRFEQEQYLIDKPLCLSCPEPELFEQALRIFHGRAFYDGTGELEPEFLSAMSEKYGLVCL